MFQYLVKHILSLLLFLISAASFSQQYLTFEKYSSKWMESPELSHANIGLSFIDAENGKTIIETSPQSSLVPGSILKLLTTGAALEILGSDYRFETQLAYSGEIKNDTLYGNLIIIGGGDPALGSKYFKDDYLQPHFIEKWAHFLQKMQVKAITGDIIANAAAYEKQMVPNTWIWEDLGNYYGAGVCGLTAYDNLYDIHISSPEEAGQKTQILKIVPQIPELEIENEVTSSNINRDLAYVFGSPFDSKRVLRGTIPKGETDFTIKASIPNPPLLLATQLKDELFRNGIVSLGRIRVDYETNPENVKVLDKIASPPLIDIIRVTNYESVNLFAEHLQKQLAFVKKGKGSGLEGMKIIEQFWNEKGIDTKGLFLADGCGLSHFNSMTAKQMTAVLFYMKHQSLNGKLFFSSIPTVPDGTLYVFNTKNFPNNCLKAKSGSMTRVRCYAGSLVIDSGKELLFTVMLNNFSCSQATAIDLIEDLLVAARKEL